MSYRLAWCCLVLGGLALSQPARSATVTFNGTAADGLFTLFDSGNSPYSEAGFLMTFDSGSVFFLDDDWSSNVALFDDDVLDFDTVGAQVTFTRVGGAPFDAVSFFGGARSLGTLNFLGNLDGGGTVSQNFGFAAGEHTQTALSGFDNLDSLVISASAGIPVIDDLQLLAAVPEPSTALLLGLGLAGFASRRRRLR